MTTPTNWRWVLLPLVLAVTACGDSGFHLHTGHGHSHHSGHGHAHEAEGLVYTDYSEVSELFLEFPPLIAGRGAPFAAHVTRLADFAPLTSGRLDVVLRTEGRTVARFRVDAPVHPGIFMPTVTPRDPGTFDLSIAISDGEWKAEHHLGPVTVFASAEAVTLHRHDPEGDITYLKEQQWSDPFATVVAANRPLRASVPGFATVRAPADGGAEIRAPADGYIGPNLQARAGMAVAADERLAELVPRLGEGADFGHLTVQLERARAQWRQAERDVERLEQLFGDGAVSERQLFEAQQLKAVARAELASARARLEQAQRGEGNAAITLRAPVSGEIVEMNAHPGALVREGERIFQIAAAERRWLEIRIPERFAADLRQASGAWFRRETGETVVLDSSSGARIVQTGGAIDPLTRTAGVTLEYATEQAPGLIGARFAVHLFVEAPESRLAIPRSAVIDDGGRPVVYVQTGGETFARRPVTLGRTDGRWVEVVSGVAAGERVVAEGAYYVKLAATGGEAIGHGHVH